MTEELEQLKGSGKMKNEKGLVYFPKGRILRTSCPAVNRFKTFGRELKDLTRRQINEDLTAMEQVLGLTTKEAMKLRR